VAFASSPLSTISAVTETGIEYGIDANDGDEEAAHMSHGMREPAQTTNF